jgi:hypothetical protein
VKKIDSVAQPDTCVTEFNDGRGIVADFERKRGRTDVGQHRHINRNENGKTAVCGANDLDRIVQRGLAAALDAPGPRKNVAIDICDPLARGNGDRPAADARGSCGKGSPEPSRVASAPRLSAACLRSLPRLHCRWRPRSHYRLPRSLPASLETETKLQEQTISSSSISLSQTDKIKCACSAKPPTLWRQARRLCRKNLARKTRALSPPIRRLFCLNRK